MEETPTAAPEDVTATAGTEASGKKRPRIDQTVDVRERKRGKSMFGILLGTLNKAKKEDQDRNASEAVGDSLDLRGLELYSFFRQKKELILTVACWPNEPRRPTMSGESKS